MKKAIVSLSGGMDSLTCLAMAIDDNYDVYLLHVNYGQKTELRELAAFNDIGDHYEISEENRLIIDVDYLKQIGGSSLTDPNIPVTDANLDTNEIPSSVVPFRNCGLLAIAVSWGEVIGASKIYAGMVEEDSSGYRDCRQEFVEAFNKTIIEGTNPKTKLEVVTPIITMKKAEIIKTAIALRAPLNLSWSCYQSNGPKACSICDSCLLRLRGFHKAGIYDPIQYENDSVRDSF